MSGAGGERGPFSLLIVLVAALALLAGCETFAGRDEVAGPPLPAQQTKATVRPGDTFEMHLGGVPAELAQEFNIGYTVNQEGGVNMPKLGIVKVSGLTLAEVEKLIQNQLIARGIFTHPSVTINPSANSRVVVVGGGVRTPQRLVWSPDLTARTAVDLAGGLTDFGSLRGLKIIRNGQVRVYDGRKFASNPAQDPKLLPGDQIIVRQ